MAIQDDPVPALKRQLASEIATLLGHTNQYVAAKRIGLDQPRMSELLHGNLTRFSLQKLVRLLAKVDREVTMTVRNVGPAVLRLHDFPPRKPLAPRRHQRSL